MKALTFDKCPIFNQLYSGKSLLVFLNQEGFIIYIKILSSVFLYNNHYLKGVHLKHVHFKDFYHQNYYKRVNNKKSHIYVDL